MQIQPFANEDPRIYRVNVMVSKSGSSKLNIDQKEPTLMMSFG
jgi:hypothetical protein